MLNESLLHRFLNRSLEVVDLLDHSILDLALSADFAIASQNLAKMLFSYLMAANGPVLASKTHLLF